MALSSLHTIAVDVEKFFSNLDTSVGKFAAAFERDFAKAPAAIQTINNFIGEAAPIIEGAVALADPALEPEAAGALSLAETGLAAIQASATAANSGQGLLANLQNFATTVPADLAAIQVKDPALKAKVQAVINFIVGEAKVIIPAVMSWVTQLEAAATAEGTTKNAAAPGTTGN